MASALKKIGIEELWATIGEYRAARSKENELDIQREDQAASWLWAELSESLMNRLKNHERVAASIDQMEADVKAGKISPTAGAKELLAVFLGK